MEYKIIKFGASWCGPFRVLEQKLRDFDKCEVIVYDVDDTDYVTDFLSPDQPEYLKP